MFNSNGSTLSLNANNNSLKTNEVYNCLVYIEGLPNSKSESMNISTLFSYDYISIFHNLLIILKAHLMSKM